MKKLVWRLNAKPTVSEVTELLREKIISPAEAKEILFNEEEPPKKATTSEIDDVRKEVELLREVVLALASSKSAASVIYKYTDVWKYPWTQPYVTYCSANTPLDYSPTVTYTAYTSNSLLK